MIAASKVARAITVHQALLQRTNLTRLEHAYVLLCLGLDFRHGGFVDRALVPRRRVSPRPLRYGALGVSVGLFAAVLVALLVDYLRRESRRPSRAAY